MKNSILFLVALLWALSAAASNVTIATKTLPDGTVNIPYAATILTAGGCTPMTWKVGTLPTGIVSTVTNKTKSLALSGTPTAAGTWSFSISVIGCSKHTASAWYDLTIQPATPATHWVDLFWDSDTEAVSYSVYRELSGGSFALLASAITATSYTDSTVLAGQTYLYAATAINASGQESDYSNVVEAVIPSP